MHKISCYRLSEGSITISLLFLFFSTTEPCGFIFFTSISRVLQQIRKAMLRHPEPFKKYQTRPDGIISKITSDI